MPIRIRTLLSCLALLASVSAALLARPVLAQQSSENARVEVEICEIGVPLLGQLPFLDKLFQDHEFKSVGGLGYLVCEVNDGKSACSAAGSFCQQACCEQTANAKVVSKPCCEEEAVLGISKFELITSLNDAMCRVAALQATLEARDEFAHQKEEMLSSLAEAMVENARLQAHTEQLEERLAMQAEVAEARIENARLQARLELVAQREQLIEKQAKAAVKNHKLQLRLAKLEKKHSAWVVAKKKEAAARQAKKQYPQAGEYGASRR